MSIGTTSNPETRRLAESTGDSQSAPAVIPCAVDPDVCGAGTGPGARWRRPLHERPGLQQAVRTAARLGQAMVPGIS